MIRRRCKDHAIRVWLSRVIKPDGPPESSPEGFDLIKARLPKSALNACISSRIATVIHFAHKTK